MEWEQQTRGDPLPRGVTQVCAAWVEIICNPSYSGEYRINFISSLILPILLRNWSYITEAVPMCWSQKGDLWLWLVSSEPRANSPASYSIRAIYYSCVLQYWRICRGYLMAAAMCSQGFILVSACYMVASSYHASYSIRACHLTHVGLSISLK